MQSFPSDTLGAVLSAARLATYLTKAFIHTFGLVFLEICERAAALPAEPSLAILFPQCLRSPV